MPQVVASPSLAPQLQLAKHRNYAVQLKAREGVPRFECGGTIVRLVGTPAIFHT